MWFETWIHKSKLECSLGQCKYLTIGKVCFKGNVTLLVMCMARLKPYKLSEYIIIIVINECPYCLISALSLQVIRIRIL